MERRRRASLQPPSARSWREETGARGKPRCGVIHFAVVGTAWRNACAASNVSWHAVLNALNLSLTRGGCHPYPRLSSAARRASLSLATHRAAMLRRAVASLRPLACDVEASAVRAASSVTKSVPVHPPQQSLRPAALPGDRSHTEKWLQARLPRVALNLGSFCVTPLTRRSCA